MKHVCWSLLLRSAFIALWSNTDTFAQRFGNEWINYQQTYFKIAVAQKGIYRLSTAELRQAGLPVGSVNPTAVQVFFRGQEQAIYVQGEADGRFDEGDFVEFYGEGNDGTQDSLLYMPHSAQPHKFYNLYSDTTAYFLTWRLDGQLGKRMGFYQESNTANLPSEAFHREDLWISNIASQSAVGMSEGLMYPLGISGGAQQSYYDFGEGWTGPELTKSRAATRRIDLENVLRVGSAPQIEVHLMGRDHRQHAVELRVGATARSSRVSDTLRFDFQNALLVKRTLSWNDLLPDSSRLYLTTTSLGITPTQTDDVYSVTYYRVRYSQRIDFQNKTQKYFYLNPNSGGRAYLEIPNTTPDTRLFDVTDRAHPVRVEATFENSRLRAMVRQTQTERTLLATRTPLTAPAIQRVVFRNINPTQHNYLIVTHRVLAAAAKTYAGYRATSAGGRYDTLVVQTDQLVNQFNYGEFSPLAIRRFVQFMAEQGNPRFLFIIGRTQQVDFTRTARDRDTRDMVPTWGWPGSDNLFSHGLKGQPPLVAGIPTGRLWTDSPQTVLNYLEKVREHEATPMNGLWRKNILHLSGGISPFEQAQFLGIMNGYKQQSQRPFWGAKVTTITKKTDEAVEYVGIANEINEGVGIITLFGHSSLSITDIDVGFVSDDVLGYRNKGRYPLVFANGCVLGNFTFGANTYPTDWVNTKDRGAILFLAHSNVAFVYSLRDFANTFYQTLLADSNSYNRPFGEVHQQITKRFLAKYPDDPIYKADAQQMSLQGDPGVVIFPTKQPDYALTPQSISVVAKNGGPVSALADSLELRLVVANFGLYRPEKLPVRLVRTFRDGTTQAQEQQFESVAYQDTLRFRLPNDRTQSGLNRFELTLDPHNTLTEITKNNNTASVEINLPALGAYPLLPAEYAVVSTSENNQPMATLVAQQVENISRNYVFEIDTTARFDSPLKRSQTLLATLLPTWKVTLPNRDSTTYYWRIRYADRPATTDNPWSESSFTYLRNGGEGWLQRQPAQFVRANPLNINLSTTTSPVWTYRSNTASISANLTGTSVGGFNQGWRQSRLYIDNILLVTSGNCTSFDRENNFRPGNNVVAVALRRDNLQAYSVMPSAVCGNPPYVANTLRDRDIINNRLLEKWLDAVPQGDWVLLMTVGDIQFDQWPAATKAKLRTIGVGEARIAEIRSGRPYLWIGQKGATQLTREVLTDPDDIAPSLRTVVLDNFKLQSQVGQGQIVSSLIGPAASWGSTHRRWTANRSQQAAFDIIGVGLDGKESLLTENIAPNALSLSHIDAQKYPFLRWRLRLSNNDLTVSLPAQLQHWGVNFSSVAEGSASTNLNGLIERQEGEPLTVNVAFKNIAPVSFGDSILVRQTLVGAIGRPQVTERKIKRLGPNEENTYSITLPTVGQVGDNRLIINFNPRHQPEQNYTNNIVNVPFSVIADRLPPVLEVSFDGQRIKDGDVVSATPLILIHLKDENRFLFKRDTAGIELFLQSPNQSVFRRIAFSNNAVRFFAANNQNLTRIEYRPTLPDGIYTLRVQGTDASGNRTGVYQISFRVINEQRLFSVVTAPNPFRELLKISYVVTGREAPTETRITLTDMTGRVVTMAQVPPRVGVNEWFWPVPSHLPAGAYLYRVEVFNNGQPLPLEEGTTTSGKVLLVK